MLSNPIEELTSYVLTNLQETQNEINNKLKEFKAGDDDEAKYESTVVCNYATHKCNGTFVLTFKLWSGISGVYEEGGTWYSSVTVVMNNSDGNQITVECVKVLEHSVKSITTVALGVMLKQLISKGV